MEFTLTISADWNYTPSDLMNRYAKNTRGVTFFRDRYFSSYICKNGVWYEYSHLKTKQTDNPDFITVTVYLKEKKQ